MSVVSRGSDPSDNPWMLCGLERRRFHLDGSGYNFR